jgi:phage-related minor tail protein
MDNFLDTLVVNVRADTQGLKQSLGQARGDFDALAVGAQSAAGRMERAFEKFARTGEFSFETLKSVALGVLGDIASAALHSGIDAIFGKGKGGGGGLGTILVGGVLGALGLPGRATGGPVSGGSPYLVGERGPELFVPNGYGRVEALQSSQGRGVSITINMNGSGQEPRHMARSANQVAAAVRRAMTQSEGLA